MAATVRKTNSYIKIFSLSNQTILEKMKLIKSQTDKELSRKIVMNVYPLPHYDDIDPSNNVKMLQKLVF